MSQKQRCIDYFHYKFIPFMHQAVIILPCNQLHFGYGDDSLLSTFLQPAAKQTFIDQNSSLLAN